ncbi:neuronal acetylcholine receptor subunit alpha-7-like [Apteryx mantelli]|uniref:Neuronal acetylcholine receptor subunit alpha-7-like n=1 Tax=Apteryx mantelli TaxID=2696672 RepID=A0ABM4G4J5_9AVES
MAGGSAGCSSLGKWPAQDSANTWKVVEELVGELLAACQVLTCQSFFPRLAPGIRVGRACAGWSPCQHNNSYSLLVPLRPPPGHAFHLEVASAPQQSPWHGRICAELQCTYTGQRVLGDVLCFLHQLQLRLGLESIIHVSQQGEGQRRLYRDLLRNYSRLERPVVNDSQPLVVELQLSLLQIIDVDEKNQVLITNAWLQMYWVDVYLSWDQYEYPGVQNLRFPADQIWVPDILLYNSADERFDATFHTNVLVNYSGSCQYIPPGILKSTCYIDVRWFPFDVQRCDLKFGSWTHSGWLLDLQMLEADISNYISNGEWDLVGVPGKRNEMYYECCKEPYPVTMRRRTLYYGLNLLIPCVLISALALLVFLLPADSGEKISLGITVLLSLTVFMLLVAEIMPATSDSVPLIAQYFASIMVIVGLSVVVTVLVLQFHHHDPQAGKMPKWVSSFGGKYSTTC